MRTLVRLFSLRAFLGAVRGLFVLALTVGAAAVLGLRHAKAEATEALLGFGGELMHWADTSVHGTPRRLALNGLEFHLVTASTSLPVKETLERLRGLCRQRGGIQAPEALLRGREAPLPGLGAGTISSVGEHEGVIACLDTAGPLDVGDLAHRLERMSQSGDLSDLGQLRYMLARREGEVTTALIVWTEGSAPVFRAFPAAGDAPGTDPQGCPRPPGARRLLAAAESGAPYSVTVYAVDGADLGWLHEWYEHALSRAGWKVRRAGGNTTLLAERGVRRLTVHLDRTGAGRTTATVLELS